MSLKETKKLDTNRYQLEITIDGEKFREAIKEAYRKNGKKINVPGFRKGKAPKAIIEKMYGAGVFYEDEEIALKFPAQVGGNYAVRPITGLLQGDAIDLDGNTYYGKMTVAENKAVVLMQVSQVDN